MNDEKSIQCDGDGVNLLLQDDEDKNNIKLEYITIRVGGLTYQLDIDDVRRAPSSRLYRYVFVRKMTSMSFNRPIQSFGAILAYFQTGELHMPLSFCPGAFKTELEFWGLDPQLMSKCCYYRYISYLDDQDTLDRFHLHLFPDAGLVKPPHYVLNHFRSSIWKVLDNVDGSMITKVYFAVSVLMVILSVLTLALSTVPYFKRGLTKCELEEYLGTSVMSLNSTLDPNDTCTEPIPDEVYDSLFVDFDTINVTERKDLLDNDIIVEEHFRQVPSTPEDKSGVITEPPGDKNSSQNGMVRSFFDPSPNAGSNVVADEVMFEQVFESLRPRLMINKKTVRIQTLVYLDTAVLAFFTADLLLRVFTCPSIKRYFLSTINIIDACVILSAYAYIAINVIRKDAKYTSSNYDLLEVCQVLRVVRLLRVVRNVTGFKVLTFSLKVSLKDLLVLFLYLLLGVTIFANFIYFVENEGAFSSIPVGWWWAITTMTTVGYGDITPVTFYGRLIGGICAISGVVMMAVAIPLLVKTFMLLYQYAVLYKKTMVKPEDTSRYIHRQGVLLHSHGKNLKNCAPYTENNCNPSMS